MKCVNKKYVWNHFPIMLEVIAIKTSAQRKLVVSDSGNKGERLANFWNRSVTKWYIRNEGEVEINLKILWKEISYFFFLSVYTLSEYSNSNWCWIILFNFDIQPSKIWNRNVLLHLLSHLILAKQKSAFVSPLPSHFFSNQTQLIKNITTEKQIKRKVKI